jgi:hypothetical protein
VEDKIRVICAVNSTHFVASLKLKKMFLFRIDKVNSFEKEALVTDTDNFIEDI